MKIQEILRCDFSVACNLGIYKLKERVNSNKYRPRIISIGTIPCALIIKGIVNMSAKFKLSRDVFLKTQVKCS